MLGGYLAAPFCWQVCITPPDSELSMKSTPRKRNRFQFIQKHRALGVETHARSPHCCLHPPGPPRLPRGATPSPRAITERRRDSGSGPSCQAGDSLLGDLGSGHCSLRACPPGPPRPSSGAVPHGAALHGSPACLTYLHVLSWEDQAWVPGRSEGCGRTPAGAVEGVTASCPQEQNRLRPTRCCFTSHSPHGQGWGSRRPALRGLARRLLPPGHTPVLHPAPRRRGSGAAVPGDTGTAHLEGPGCGRGPTPWSQPIRWGRVSYRTMCPPKSCVMSDGGGSGAWER